MSKKLATITLTPDDKDCLVAFYRAPDTANGGMNNPNSAPRAAAEKGLIENAFGSAGWWKLTRLGKSAADELVSRGLLVPKRCGTYNGFPAFMLTARGCPEFWQTETTIQVETGW